MKKFFATMMGICMLAACCSGMAACNFGKGPDESGPDTPGPDQPGPDQPGDPTVTDDSIQTDRDAITFAFDEIYNEKMFVDEENGFNSSADVTGARFFLNGEYYNKLSKVGSRQDVKLELYNGQAARMVNVSAGMEFTIPTSESVKADYTIAKYRTQYEFGDSILTFSANGNNPYTALSNAWYVYVNEWAIRHLVNPKYYDNNGLTLLNDLSFEVTPVGENGKSDGERTYPTVKNGDLEMRSGYEIYRFDIQINDVEDGEVERPFYNIGIIHETNDVKNFGLFVMKSKSNKAEMMDKIMMSYKKISPKGITRNYFENKDPVQEPQWNEETKAFFNQFMTQTSKSWGVFSYSMPGDESSLDPANYNYKQHLNWSKDIQKFIEETAWGGKKYDVYMTYTHLGSGPIQDDPNAEHYADGYDDNRHHFPLEMAKELAGGNGVNGKPVLEFTYQYTTNNNLVDQEVTPMFDIMRGKYDKYFERLARDIKAYGKPVMFRLNNEMNTDWTSYSGIMNLLDPDIFTMTWQRLYKIFLAQGCDNVIWVWNPIADSCPYSGWGEDLCYFPGFEYVQLLGGTNYEATNDRNQFQTFRERYESLYNKNKTYFEKWGMIIGEFACGSGGDYTGALGRNRDLQEQWVTGMFEELNAENPAPYAQQIKGLIWFNCNDYAGDNVTITNRYRFADIPGGSGYHKGEDYSDQKGFADAAAKENK